MVKIRYAGNGVALSSRALIEQAITNTSAKFDNNIIANRFEQTTTSTYEVTIKCVSSRGKGAKRGTTGRRTTSCCWHAWGTFFDELFRLNPAIVIVAQGNRITRESGNWVDRIAIPATLRRESEMCDCEQNGWVREEFAAPHRTTVNIDSYEPCRSCTFNVGMRCVFGDADELARPVGCPFADHSEPVSPVRRCDASCRHNSAHHDGRLCSGRNCLTSDVPGWEPYIPPTVNRSCATCRYSNSNTMSHASECPPGRCLREEGLQHWELYTPSQPTVRRHCCTCRYSSTNTRRGLCTMTHECPERDGFPRWEQYIPSVTPRCVNCAYSSDRRATLKCPRNRDRACLTNGYRNFVRWVDDPTPSNQRWCRDCKYSAGNNGGESCDCAVQCLIGSEHRLFVKWVASPTVVKTCETCKYSYSRNNDIPCFNVVGSCGLGLPKWVQWIPDIDLEGFNPELYMQQPTVMPEEGGYMDFEGVV